MLALDLICHYIGADTYLILHKESLSALLWHLKVKDCCIFNWCYLSLGGTKQQTADI